MVRVDHTLWCDGCGVEITWGPHAVDKRQYCCQDCADGFRCDCGTRMEMEDDRRAGGGGADLSGADL